MPRNLKVGVGTAIIVHDGPRVLLGRRCGTLCPGTWALPGGWLDPNEQPTTAVLRELKEETGMEMSAVGLRLLGAYAHDLPSIDCWCLTVYYTLACNPLLDPTPQVTEPDKVSEWRWFDVRDPLAVPQPLMSSTASAVSDFILRDHAS